jgi:hypothetical protein
MSAARNTYFVLGFMETVNKHFLHFFVEFITDRL